MTGALQAQAAAAKHLAFCRLLRLFVALSCLRSSWEGFLGTPGKPWQALCRVQQMVGQGSPAAGPTLLYWRASWYTHGCRVCGRSRWRHTVLNASSPPSVGGPKGVVVRCILLVGHPSSAEGALQGRSFVFRWI